jgi:hypothetical protein
MTDDIETRLLEIRGYFRGNPLLEKDIMTLVDSLVHNLQAQVMELEEDNREVGIANRGFAEQNDKLKSDFQIAVEVIKEARNVAGFASGGIGHEVFLILDKALIALNKKEK